MTSHNHHSIERECGSRQFDHDGIGIESRVSFGPPLISECDNLDCVSATKTTGNLFLLSLFPPLIGRRLHGFLGLSLNDRAILFLVISGDKTVSVG